MATMGIIALHPETERVRYSPERKKESKVQTPAWFHPDFVSDSFGRIMPTRNQPSLAQGRIRTMHVGVGGS